MPKKAKELGPLDVSRLSEVGLTMVGGVAGLGLQVSPTGAKSWVLRVMVGGKRRDMGLGGYPDVTLAGARDSARNARAKIKEGIDPVEDARQKRSELYAARASAMTFSEAASAYIAVKEAEWRNDKHGQQWRNTLATYAEPIIGNILVRDIGQSHILKVLEPIWLEKTETAKRLRGRIESILDWARVRGYRDGENPARWRGHLQMLLQSPGKVQKVEHHPALPYVEIGAFLALLRQEAGTAARALEFAILTAARSGEVRGATWEEIDLDAALWIIPAERMKAKKEHRVTLNEGAAAILEATPKEQRAGLIFRNGKGKQFSDAAMSSVLRRMKRSDITVHGFRSTFRDWAAECTNYPREVAEMALAHVIENKVEAAYRRGDLFDKRQRLMRDWWRYTNKTEGVATVTPIKSKAVA